MPADLVTGQDADGRRRLRGRGGRGARRRAAQGPGGPGAQVFANNGCAGCHTLAAANAGGITGPDLDEVLPGQTAAAGPASRSSDPNAKITTGLFPERDARRTTSELISPQQLQQLVDYLISSTKGS